MTKLVKASTWAWSAMLVGCQTSASLLSGGVLRLAITTVAPALIKSAGDGLTDTPAAAGNDRNFVG